ncbi:cation-transporting P-type ATPase [Desulfonatronospira sp.]|uniref:cation-transporting P-type ATPase n=1 Tax=Desulfonatronospira sp. TaxID=1962951 RepID=UPI0025B9DF0C|nr:cation-transporting P-type ATPase [Desulfonatronospira sp.]
MNNDHKIDKEASWHSMPVREVLGHLQTSEDGLDSSQAGQRLDKYGPNKLPRARKQGPFKRFLLQFHNVLIYVLLVATIVTALMQQWVDSAVIFAVCLVNALIGFIQEGKAEKSMESLQGMLAPAATVLRDKQKKTLPAEELVPGDVVILSSGDKVPADLRLFQARDLQIEEAALTGESVPVAKNIYEADPEAGLGDRSCMAFSGTMVSHGQGAGVVAATGAHTQIGRISTMLAQVQTLTTPLLKKITRFGHFLTVAILVTALATFAFGILVRGLQPFEMFMAGVGLAVSAIPVGLPAIMTITLAIGVQRMARRNAIIRKLPALETLGAVTTICSDKTGTLTKNQMTVQSIQTSEDLYSVTGTGYNPQGKYRLEGQDIDPLQHFLLAETLRAVLLCNEAHLYHEENEDTYRLEGASTEGALVAAAIKAGLDQKQENTDRPRIDSIPFSSDRKFMATLHDYKQEGGRRIILKGAPERVLERCSHQSGPQGPEELDPDFWHKSGETIASRGQRLLAVAYKEVPENKKGLEEEDTREGFTLLGLFGIIDPPREEAVKAAARLIGRCVSVRDCQSAGINVKMITGDHALTAVSIADELGIGDGRTFLTGKDLEKMSDEELDQKVTGVDVYARTSPEHKLRLVQALQAGGNIVAMTGDGVNDAPALKRADVGVAMGKGGTEAAREASDVVLADDNFASIANAVEEGRTIYDNLKKAILFILPTNGGQALVVMASIVLGIGLLGEGGEYTLPISPPQILWINMIIAVTLALALAFEPPEGNVMSRPPRPPDEPLISGFLIWRVASASVLLVIGTLWHYQYMLAGGASHELASTTAINTLVVGQVFYLINSRFIHEPAWRIRGFLGSRAVLISIAILAVLQLGFTYLPFMQYIFQTEPVCLESWIRIILFGIILFLAVEMEKAFFRRRTGD